MAITKGIPTIKVVIHADGAPLQEHEDEDEVVANDGEVTRYIEATTGQTFSININVGAGTQFVGDSFAFHVCVDGHMVDSTITRRTGEVHTGSTVTSQGRYLAAGTVQKYRFADLDKSGDRNPTREEMEVFKQLGEIRIVAHHQIRRDTGAHIEAAPSQASSAVSEGALKGQTLSHSVGSVPFPTKFLAYANKMQVRRSRAIYWRRQHVLGCRLHRPRYDARGCLHLPLPVPRCAEEDGHLGRR